MNKNRVIVGMSGGVDSSVAAYLLKEQGFEVIGVTMQIWPDNGKNNHSPDDGGCCSLSAVDDARRVSQKLSIPYYVMNFKDVFESRVIDYFIEEYFRGRTPNPCIACNRYVKFQELLRRAHSLDAHYIATGHYAKIEYDENKGIHLLRKSITKEKDQTYALYNMTQYQLEHTLMPVGDYTKEEIRKIAEELGLPVASKPDSQEICFVTNNDYAAFLVGKYPNRVKPGHFVDIEGNILGQHKGVIHYTIGQRKGLGIALGKQMFVIDIDADKDIVVLGEGESVYAKELLADDINWIIHLEPPMKVNAKIRYNSQEQPAQLYSEDGGRVRVVFDEPQRAITPGQSVVFYQDDLVVGGGIIVKKYR